MIIIHPLQPRSRSSDSSGLRHCGCGFLDRTVLQPSACLRALAITTILTLVVTPSDSMIPAFYFWNCIFRNPTHHHQRLQAKDERMLSRHCSGSNAPKPAMLLRHQYIQVFPFNGYQRHLRRMTNLVGGALNDSFYNKTFLLRLLRLLRHSRLIRLLCPSASRLRGPLTRSYV
jgi:hypothetical protein